MAPLHVLTANTSLGGWYKRGQIPGRVPQHPGSLFPPDSLSGADSVGRDPAEELSSFPQDLALLIPQSVMANEPFNS